MHTQAVKALRIPFLQWEESLLNECREAIVIEWMRLGLPQTCLSIRVQAQYEFAFYEWSFLDRFSLLPQSLILTLVFLSVLRRNTRSLSLWVFCSPTSACKLQSTLSVSNLHVCWPSHKQKAVTLTCFSSLCQFRTQSWQNYIFHSFSLFCSLVY